MNVPLMSLFVSPQFALAVMMPILIVMDMIIIWHYRNSWDRSIVLMLIPGAILGVIIGAMTFHFMNADIIKFIVGLISIILVVQFFFISKSQLMPKPSGKVIPFILGGISGLLALLHMLGDLPLKVISSSKNQIKQNLWPQMVHLYSS